MQSIAILAILAIFTIKDKFFHQTELFRSLIPNHVLPSIKGVLIPPKHVSPSIKGTGIPQRSFPLPNPAGHQSPLFIQPFTLLTKRAFIANLT